MTIIALGSIGVFYAGLGKGFKPQTERLVFTRNVSKDGGVKLDPSSVISKEGTRLTEVFSLERINRIGADANPPDGIGLTVIFLTMNGTREIKREVFSIPEWKKHLDTSYGKRREIVEQAAIDFKKSIAIFTDPVRLNLTFGIVVDTTEGVDPRLKERVQEVIGEIGALELVDKGHSVVLNMYHITESSYQGGRRRIKLKPSNVTEAEQWLLSGTEQSNSSVLRGLRSILQEIFQAGGNPRLDIFTDGLENLPELSVYKNPELLEDDNWGRIDEVAHIEALKLKGMEIHLYPLPPRNSRHEEMMEKGLAYLEDRLKKAGAEVKLESF